MDFAATLEYMLDMYEHTKDIFIIDMHVCMYVKKENLTAHSSIIITTNNSKLFLNFILTMG